MAIKHCAIIIVAGLLFFAIQGCNRHYTNPDFDRITASHSNIAVLPFEMIYSGKEPMELSEEDIMEIEVAESKAFQISFYNEVLISTRNNRKPIRVNLQSYTRTLNKLDQAGISIRESWSTDAEQLADILEVDAVVRGRIEKRRFFTDLEAFGLSVAANILNQITDRSVFPWIPDPRAKEITVNFSLHNISDGTTLWTYFDEVDADWSRPSDEIIDDISRRAARRFPYRE